jgi:hypothetical protein
MYYTDDQDVYVTSSEDVFELPDELKFTPAEDCEYGYQ